MSINNKILEKIKNDISVKNTKLLIVTKTRSQEDINQLIKMGYSDFAENRVQEAQEKFIDILPNKDIKLNLIGPLQSNKVKQALKLFNIIETIDREKLAREISNNLNNQSKTKNFYIQINTGSENQKSGLTPSEADHFIEYCTKDLKLPIIGLMCIPPQDEESSMHFAFLKKIAKRNNLTELSMGMSNDFEEAIKFGTTSVRIGSLFFGAREL